jgi:hypothetical protein
MKIFLPQRNQDTKTHKGKNIIFVIFRAWHHFAQGLESMVAGGLSGGNSGGRFSMSHDVSGDGTPSSDGIDVHPALFSTYSFTFNHRA